MQRTGGDGLTNIAPHRGRVDHVILPDEYIDAVEEALASDLEDIKNTTNVPGCIHAR